MNTTAQAANIAQPSKALHITLWIAQALLAVAFLGSGFMKLTSPIADMAVQMPYTQDLPEIAVRIIGSLEILGAIGLLLPSLLRIKPFLTSLAALGLLATMIGAAGLHASRGEMGNIPVNLVLGAIAAFIAWGRSKKSPITPRG
ncbi:MAG TPA: DoxX family protein [Patescibacteria group bacterium]|nr:DoxX family protein [Patescibacteria group bacterium]